MNLKIGILTGKFNDLSNWQLRIIQAILNDPTLELAAIIHQDGDRKGLDNGSPRRAFSKLGLGRFLFALQLYMERKIFFKEVYCIDKKSLIHKMEQLPKMLVGQSSKTSDDALGLETIEQLQQHDFDLLINLGSHNIPLELIKVSKYGIWDFLHTDFSSTQQGPVGFSEVLQKKPSIGFTLIKRTGDVQVELIDHAFFNRGWSMVESATIAQEGGVSVLLKNLKKLQAGHEFELNSQNFPRYEYPGFLNVLKYTVQFYQQVWSKIDQKLAYTFWGRRHECWSIFIGRGSFLESSRTGMQPLKMSKDEFWADPFLFKHQGADYVFFENYSFKTKRGKISCGRVKNQELFDIVDVLDFDYHLSYPFIFEENGAIFLMPETSENKRLEIYKAVDFPMKWELYTTAFEGEMVADAFFYNDEQHQKWLFVNKQAAETSQMNSELFIYKTDSIKLENLQPHAQNPVIIDARVARNGGSIFTHKNGLFRPSQRNTDGIYGRALNINRINTLTLDDYEEENIRISEPDFDKNLMATHHLHQIEDLFVFDAAYKAK